MRVILAFLSLSTVLSAPLAHPSPSLPSPPLVLLHTTVIDVTGELVRSAMTLGMTSGRITTMGQTDTVRLPFDAQVVDATGTFVIPGLYDMHAHWYLKEYLPKPAQKLRMLVRLHG